MDRVVAAIREPGTGTFALLAAAGVAVIAIVLVLRGKLAARAEAAGGEAPTAHGS
jgi:hypothetical protein